MDLSLAVVSGAGLLATYLFQKLTLPGRGGMLPVGILAGPPSDPFDDEGEILLDSSEKFH
ncbi:MAG: hypothetical protein WCD80_02120 [Desulfobaccales bacterium]